MRLLMSITTAAYLSPFHPSRVQLGLPEPPVPHARTAAQWETNSQRGRAPSYASGFAPAVIQVMGNTFLDRTLGMGMRNESYSRSLTWTPAETAATRSVSAGGIEGRRDVQIPNLLESTVASDERSQLPRHTSTSAPPSQFQVGSPTPDLLFSPYGSNFGNFALGKSCIGKSRAPRAHTQCPMVHCGEIRVLGYLYLFSRVLAFKYRTTSGGTVMSANPTIGEVSSVD